MIPKTIHYCWFGGNPKPKLVQKCIASWKKYCPDYSIIEWNEENYDLDSAPLFVQQAIEAKKWAFATDYIRLKIIHEYGGIYLDTDVELIKNLDTLLDNKVYFGFEYPDRINTGLGFGAEKGRTILQEMMRPYETDCFVDTNGKTKLVVNGKKETEILLQHGLQLNGIEQVLEGDIHVYPVEYLDPYDRPTGILSRTDNTYSIHWYTMSWTTRRARIRSIFTRPLHRIFGTDFILFRLMRKRRD